MYISHQHFLNKKNPEAYTVHLLLLKNGMIKWNYMSYVPDAFVFNQRFMQHALVLKA